MSQTSWPYETTGTGDGDALTVADIVNRNMFLSNFAPETDGVIYWTSSVVPEGFSNAVSGLLVATNPAGDTVRIATGVALVKGWMYVNDANVDFDVSGGNASAVDLIVLRRGNVSSVSSVILAHKRGPVGGAAVVTQTADTWEIPIVSVALDGSGDFSSLTDARGFARSPLKAAAMPLPRQGGSVTDWATIGTTDYTEYRPVLQCGSVQWTGGAATSGDITVTFPVAFGGTPIALAVGRAGTGANNVTVNITSVSATQMVIHWTFTSSTSLDFFWYALGPEA